MLFCHTMRKPLLQVILFLTTVSSMAGPAIHGSASWYGEEHRGKIMANGHRFDPDKLSAASWCYPLGTKVRVTACGSTNSIEVFITDRGPAPALLRKGRIIDLSRAAFEQLANRDLGVLNVTVQKLIIGSAPLYRNEAL